MSSPQQVVEAREYLATIPENLAWQDESPKLCAAIRSVLALLDEAERVLEPFARAASIEPVMVGRGANTQRRNPSDDDAYDHRRAITWGMVRRARTLSLKLKGAEHG